MELPKEDSLTELKKQKYNDYFQQRNDDEELQKLPVISIEDFVLIFLVYGSQGGLCYDFLIVKGRMLGPLEIISRRYFNIPTYINIEFYCENNTLLWKRGGLQSVKDGEVIYVLNTNKLIS